jgi:hypothetical protein
MEFKASTLPDLQWPWCDEETQEAIFPELSADAYFMVLLAATHWTRPGEPRALRHRDVDVKNDLVTIRRAFADSDLRPITKPKRIRHIPLDPAWKELYLSRSRHLDPEGFVFCDTKGKPRGRNWCRNPWNAAGDKAGIAHITLYAGTRRRIASQAGNRGGPDSAYQQVSWSFDPRANSVIYPHLEVSPLRQVQRKASIKAIVSKSLVNAKSRKHVTEITRQKGRDPGFKSLRRHLLTYRNHSNQTPENRAVLSMLAELNPIAPARFRGDWRVPPTVSQP